MFGNLLFVLTSIFYLGLVLLNASKPATSGDNVMGYGLGLAFLGLGFTISTLLLTVSIAYKDGFDWLSSQGGVRTLLVILGWGSFAVATFFCTLLKWEWHDEFPGFIRWLAVRGAEIWLPLLMLVPAFLLLDLERRASVAPGVFQIPMKVGFVLSVAISAGLLTGWLKDSARAQTARIQQMEMDEENLNKDHLDYIAAQKPEDNIVNILALTGRFHEAPVHDAAVAKVKSHPDWEGELIELLDNPHYYYQVYSFIDGNEVDHPERFVEPLNRSIYRMAEEIKGLLTDTNNLQDWHFDHFGIERLFRAIDWQFSEPGMDFRPAVRALSEALATPPPERFKNVRFNVTPQVHAWLKKHP